MQRILPWQRPRRLALAASFFFVQAGFKLGLLPDPVTCETLEVPQKKGFRKEQGRKFLVQLSHQLVMTLNICFITFKCLSESAIIK